MDTLSQQILALEQQFFRTAGAKEEQIKQMGLTPVRYYQLLVALIATPEAMAADPVLVKRLQRLSRKGRRR